jgi:hemolysin III
MQQTKRIIVEEIFNSITHGIGSLLSIGAIIILFLLPSQTMLGRIGLIIFGSGLLFTYTISTLFHSLKFTRARKVFLILDQSAIFLLIAATYTALITQVLKNTFGLTIFIIILIGCIWGIIQKSLWTYKWEKITIGLYLLLGWIGMIVVKQLFSLVPSETILLLGLGGILYSAGIIFYAWKKLPFSHMIWHLFVLCGSICHFFAVYSISV